jgi:hypothetical protein
MSANKRSSTLVLGAFILLCSLAATAAWAGGGPKVSPNVQVNDPQQLFPKDLPSRNTTTLAVSADGFNLLAGWDDFQGFCGAPTNLACPPQSPPGLSGFAFSTDGGNSWTDGGSPEPIGNPPAYTAGHSWADRGGSTLETFYFTARLRTTSASTNSAGIGIYRGHFGAGRFVWDDSQIINSANPNDFYSRQAVAAAKDDSGSAYVVLSNIAEICDIPFGGYGQIEMWRTHDGGQTWLGPVIVSPDTGTPTDPNNPNCGADGYQQVAPAVAIGPGGQVYTVWQHGPFFDAENNNSTDSKIGFSRSLDGGATFSTPQLIVDFNNNRDNPPVGYAKNRLNDQPRITVATTGRHRGRIYVTFYSPLQPVLGSATDQTDVSTQAYLMYSDNQGRSWSTPAAIAPALPATGVKRIWPTATVRPSGDVDVVYLESRETQVTPDPTDVECNVQIGNGLFRQGPLSSLVNTYWIQSHDGGATFSPPLRVSSVTSNWCKAAFTFTGALYSNFGDYIAAESTDNRTFTAWPDERNGFSDVYFATVKGTAKP